MIVSLIYWRTTEQVFGICVPTQPSGCTASHSIRRVSAVWIFIPELDVLAKFIALYYDFLSSCDGLVYGLFDVF